MSFNSPAARAAFFEKLKASGTGTGAASMPSNMGMPAATPYSLVQKDPFASPMHAPNTQITHSPLVSGNMNPHSNMSEHHMGTSPTNVGMAPHSMAPPQQHNPFTAHKNFAMPNQTHIPDPSMHTPKVSNTSGEQQPRFKKIKSIMKG